MFGSAPPTFVVGFSSVGGNSKDTCDNILSAKECTINIISEWYIEAANWCSISAPPGFSEWPSSGLHERQSEKVLPPCVAESAASFECCYVAHHDMVHRQTATKTGTVVILEGIKIHIKDQILTQDRKKVNLDALRPISRLGGITYGVTREVGDKIRAVALIPVRSSILSRAIR